MRFPLAEPGEVMVNRSLLQQAEIGLCNGSLQWKPFVKVNGYPQIGNPPRSMTPKV
jgi:hypothetical protein